MCAGLGLDEDRHDTFADNGLCFEHSQRQFRFGCGLVKGQMLVREGFYEVGGHLARCRFVWPDMDLDILGQGF